MSYSIGRHVLSRFRASSYLALALALLGCSGEDAANGGGGANNGGGGSSGGLLDASASDVAASDGGPGSSEGPPRSGTRMVLAGSDFDGTLVIGGFRDAQLDTPCLVEPWPDGTSRCTPTGETLSGRIFSDASCSQRIARLHRAPSCPTPLPKFMTDRTECGALTAQWRLGARRTQATYYYLAGTTCTADQNTPESQALGLELYDLGAPVTSGELTKIDVSAPGTGRLSQLWYTSADGLHAPASIRDSVLNTTCTLEAPPGAPSAICAPHAISQSLYFADAACTSATIQSGTCSNATLARARGCYGSPLFHQFGAEIPGASLFAMSYAPNPAGVCKAAPLASTTMHFYQYGAAVNAVPVPRAPVASNKRIHPIAHVDGSQLLYGHNAVFDSTKQIECTPQAVGNQQLCLPRVPQGTMLYSDEDCTTQAMVAALNRGGAACAPPPMPSLVTRGFSLCGGTPEVRVVTGPYNGPLYQSGHSCEPIDPNELTVFALGNVVPLSEFAAGTAIVY